MRAAIDACAGTRPVDARRGRCHRTAPCRNSAGRARTARRTPRRSIRPIRRARVLPNGARADAELRHVDDRRCAKRRVAAGSKLTLAAGRVAVAAAVTPSPMRTSTPAGLLAQLEQRADVVVLQPASDGLVEARQRGASDRRVDAELLDHLQRQPAILVRELHHEAGTEVAGERPLRHRDRELRCSTPSSSAARSSSFRA